MSTVSATVEVQVPVERLFTALCLAWEGGTALREPATTPDVAPSGRMGTGFRLPCAGRRWKLPRDLELEVDQYLAPAGWRAISRPDGRFSWTVVLAPVGDGAALTCVLCYTPAGVASRLRDRMTGRRTRRRALLDLLATWKRDVERQDALGRLRASLEPREAAAPHHG